VRGPTPGSTQIPTKVCPTCGDTFFTQVGLNEHLRLGEHTRLTVRQTTPRGHEKAARQPRRPKGSPTPPKAREKASRRFSDEGLERLRQVGNRLASLRRRCDGCGRVLGCGAMGLHQKASGHTGWTEMP